MRTLLTILFVSSLFAQAQENKQKLHGHSISFVPLTGLFVTEFDPPIGLPFHVDATFLYRNQRVKFALNSGGELFSLYGSPPISHLYLDIGILTGREKPLNKWLFVEGYAGASFFAKIINIKETDRYTGEKREVELYTPTIGLPLQVRLRFQLNQRFSLVLQYHGNINHLNIVNSFGLAFDFRLGLN